MRHRRATPMFLAVALGAALAPASAGSEPIASVRTRHCPDVHEQGGQAARHVLATGLTCRLARLGIDTYLGSPQGCLTSSGCTQSGVGNYTHSYVSCARAGHAVTCRVVVPRAHGTVSFVEHPIGYPGLPGTRP